VQVRPARPGDAAAVAEVHVRTWRALADGTPVWVAEEGGRIVGFASIGDSRDTGGEGEGELLSIYVLPEAWGSGAGAGLMAVARDALRARYPTSVLWVLEDNPRARRFYEREGWRTDGERRADEVLGIAVAEVRYRLGGATPDARAR
jgi:GNAT superfamily N-acetyltransferase